MNILNTRRPDIAKPANSSLRHTLSYQAIGNLAIVLCALLVSLLVLWKTFSVGFLLDDFYHIQYFHNALAGDWSEFLAKLHGDWSGDSDGMTSYRPLLSTALLFIFFLGKQTALGFHLANILLLALCGISVFYLSNIIISLICGHCSRLTSLSAMLLFLTCPLHIESSVTATNGGDLLSGLFYLISLIAYYKYKNSANRWHIAISLFSFSCALLTKEIAVTLPAIVSISALLYPRARQSKQTHNVEILYWLELLVYGIIRTLTLGTIVGGYGSTKLSMLLRQFQAFLDGNSLQKLFLPLNEHMHFPGFLITVLLILYAVIALRAIFLLVKGKLNLPITILFLLWIIIGVLPTFQVWHIYPNMIGCRLFFISSIPFCLLLSFFATSDMTPDQSGKGKLFSRLIALSPILICFIWASLYSINLTPYEIASAQLETAKSDLKTLAANTPQQTKIILLALPKDYFGAPMLSRAEYLSTFCKPPCMNIDLSRRVFAIEQPGPGAHEFIYARPLSKILSQPVQDNTILVWSNQNNRFITWRDASGTTNFSADLQPQSPRSQLSTTGKHLISFVGPINTLSSRIAALKGNFKQTYVPIRFFWHAEMPSTTHDPAEPLFMSVPIDFCDSNCALFDLQKYPAWTYATRIVDFGLDLPQDYPVHNLQNLSIVHNLKLQPQLDLIDNNQTMTPDRANFSNLTVAHFTEGHSITLSYSLENIPDAHGAAIEIPAHGRCFPELFLSSTANARMIKTVTKQGGQITLSNSELKQYFPGLHNKVAQLRALAVNSLGKPIGLPSEPVSFAWDIP